MDFVLVIIDSNNRIGDFISTFLQSYNDLLIINNPHQYFKHFGGVYNEWEIDSWKNIVIIIIIIIILCEVLTPAYADGLSLESEWQQVSSGLQSFSRYSGQLQKYCS